MHRAQANFVSDPRVSCAIVARSVLAQLESENIKEAGRVYATTLVRLLDGYRVGGVEDDGSHGVLRYIPITATDDFPVERNAQGVQEAFHSAHVSVFPTLTSDKLFQEVSVSIRRYIPVGQREEQPAAETISLDKLKQFLTALKNALIQVAA